MYICFKDDIKTVSKVEKLRFRLRKDYNNRLDYKSRGVSTFDYSDYINVIGKESHVADLIKRKL